MTNQPTVSQTTVAQEDDLPPLEEVAPQQNTAPQQESPEDAQSTRSEKKSRKAMEKLGLKVFPGVKSVQIKQKGILMTIQGPEVYKSGGDSYVVYGVAKVDDIAKRMTQGMNATGKEDLMKTLRDLKTSTATKKEKEEEVAVDETGVDVKDIELILKQVEGVSRSKAVKALKDNGGDLVNAIMSLTGV